MGLKFLVTFTLLGLTLKSRVVKSEGNMCGMAAPDPMKHCISLRLPWQPEPLYFCMEKEKFRYRNQCTSNMQCGMDNMMMWNDTLILHAPWECCPMTSVPDHCMSNNCPPPPHNRKCVVVDNPRYSWEGNCCPSYFCEENMKPENCPGKRLDPMCVNPPQGKMNCIGFHDPYGCCTKYQCDGEGKPGLCPMQHRALQFQMQYNTSIAQMMNNMPIGAPPPARQAMMYNNNNNRMLMECIGDANCGGNMKCCSQDMGVYGGGPYMMRNVNPSYGYCMDPIMMAPINPPA